MYFKKILLAIALIGLVIAAYFAYYVYSAMFVPNTAFNNNEAYVYIESDTDYNKVRESLIPLLKDINTFDALANRKKYTTNVKAGKYIIKKDMTNNDIINSIRSNNIPVKVSFNNQNSLELLAGRIAKQIEADSTSLLEVFNDSNFLEKNGFNEATALGMYIPNSYEFFWNTSAESFRDRMLTEYNKFWNDTRLEKARKANLNPDEVVALASIVQEESKQKSEQPRIAGVYINRLKNNWPLQADPTLKFAAYKLPKYQGTLIKRVLNVHKEINSPYNTYKNVGLPPGLIAMPDISAIDAVLNFETHNYFYFAADAKKPGFHKFARTLSQHNQNAREYQRYLSQQGIRR
ncbi:endolytic transglycosylase MltG [Flavobacteriaceae bacterium S0825]|uniref:endolytic transglycosylase MltG n=1 Tax=Gaetbulibacter sp. S0825 TaxID=2720084 RepID=UPI00142FCB4A|nr:endolytic transglycosylase MltG [Gaetbulibacter sp. S0825]MCK0109155.1 endolytic transglycosylase MltG [Flavobacteriaceae bacterium S0825]NIX64790.1 endolytic transglycosylase MltG [Gaetbulibacter sp. S0825]